MVVSDIASVVDVADAGGADVVVAVEAAVDE